MANPGANPFVLPLALPGGPPPLPPPPVSAPGPRFLDAATLPAAWGRADWQREFAYGIVFRDGIDPKVQVGIHNDLANRWDRTSVVDQFAFGRWNEALLPKGATGTQVYVREGWHQESEPHFTVELRFVYGTTGVYRPWATAHVYLDFSESVIRTCDKVDGRQRWCFVKPLWAEHHRVWDSRGPRPEVLPRPPRGMRYAPKYPPVWR